MEERLPKVAGAVANMVSKTDRMSKESIGLVEFTGLKLKMKIIKQLVKMKTTRLGTRPVY